MKKLLYIPFLILSWNSLISQEVLSQKVPKLTIDDKKEGYSVFSYKIPEDGFYIFSIDGGLLPPKNCTIYYCEYQLSLKSQTKIYQQETLNIASQAQDGNVFSFNANQKDNKVSGFFTANDTVEFRLVVLKSDVNGQPHKELKITENTLVTVRQASPVTHSD